MRCTQGPSPSGNVSSIQTFRKKEISYISICSQSLPKFYSSLPRATQPLLPFREILHTPLQHAHFKGNCIVLRAAMN